MQGRAFVIPKFDRVEVTKLRRRRGCDPRYQSAADEGAI
nr:MAG TPA: hypothetical protein [Caudoviricetes sp.]